MSMYTRCTHCDSAFRVTLEQLQRSSGQVRCGVCQRVFDAFVALSASDPRTDENPEAKKTPLPFGTSTADRNPSFQTSGLTPGASATLPRPDPAPIPKAIATPPASAKAAQAREAARVIEPSALPSSMEIVEVPGISVGFGDAPQSDSSSFIPPPFGPSTKRETVESGLPSSRPAETTAPSTQAKAAVAQTRWPLWVSILGGLLLLQLLFWFRGSIANASPETRPVLQGICTVFGCEVPLPRFADRLTIEASDLQALDPTRPNRVVLSATIRNRAPDTQAFPMLELTLTDSRDQVAARKVLAPEEYLVGTVDVKQGLPSNGEATVRLRLDTGDIEAAGYRIYLFHP